MENTAKPTKEQFEDYVRIRDSGVTNMFDIRTIEEISFTQLSRVNCMYIMSHFEELAEEYGVDI